MISFSFTAGNRFLLLYFLQTEGSFQEALFLVTKDIFVLNGLSLSYNNEATDEQSIMVVATAFGKK